MRQAMIRVMVRLQSDSGANLIEYGFLAVLIAVAALLSVQFVGGATSCKKHRPDGRCFSIADLTEAGQTSRSAHSCRVFWFGPRTRGYLTGACTRQSVLALYIESLVEQLL